MAEARALVRASAILPDVGLSSLIFMLLTGIYLAAKAKAWTMPWIQASLGAIVLMGFLGGIAGRRMRAMYGTAGNESHTSLDAYRRSAAAAVLQIPVRMRSATALAIVLLMVTRSDMTTSVLIVGAALASGIFWSAATWKNRSSLANDVLNVRHGRRFDSRVSAVLSCGTKRRPSRDAVESMDHHDELINEIASDVLTVLARRRGQTE
jgi:hypothetical protein